MEGGPFKTDAQANMLFASSGQPPSAFNLEPRRTRPMAYYKDGSKLTQFNDDMFDKDWHPGQVPIFHGIFRCTGCGKEAAVNERIPPQNHHQHSVLQGPIVWRLVVWAHSNQG
jgi:hypothetical protein